MRGDRLKRGWERGKECENLFLHIKDLRGPERNAAAERLCVLTRVKEKGEKNLLTNMCVCDLQCQCMTCCSLGFDAESKLALKLNLTGFWLSAVAGRLSPLQ